MGIYRWIVTFHGNSPYLCTRRFKKISHTHFPILKIIAIKHRRVPILESHLALDGEDGEVLFNEHEALIPLVGSRGPRGGVNRVLKTFRLNNKFSALQP